jgi:hypothetical protein
MPAVFDFIRYVLPREGRTLRFYFSFLSVLACGSGSIYYHFKSLQRFSLLARLRKFTIAVASLRPPLSATRPVSVPARLLARLLRTIYLTEVLPKHDDAAWRTGPNRGYINHPHFSYGDSLGQVICSRTKTGNLP